MKSASKYEQVVRNLLEYPHEQEWFEFKVNWFEPNGLGEYISALANAAAYQGQEFGYLVWGIENETHAIVGTKFDQTKDVRREPLKHYLERQLTPDTAFAFYEFEMDGKRVVLLEIAAARSVPTAFANVRHFRIGSSKVILSKYPERESELFLLLRNGHPTLSNTEALRQDLSFEKLLVYYAAKGITLNRRTFKRNLGFLMPNGKYNLLAQLLSDNSGIPIRFAIFKGKDKTSTMYSVRELGNTCLLYSLDKALELGELLNIPQADERNRVVERKEVPLFNSAAYREAVVNAFVHNRWVDFNSPMFCVFGDRLEILSHGALPPKQTLKGFFEGISVPVNPELSSIFLQLHISERTGRGVPKIISAYTKGIFSFGENAISVILPYARLVGEPDTQVSTQVDTQVSTQVDTPVTRQTPQVAGQTPPVDTPVSTPVSTPVDTQVDTPVSTPVDTQVSTQVSTLVNIQEQILRFCSIPRGIREIANHLKFKQRKSVRRYLLPLLEQGRLAMTIPQSPNSRFQKYITIK